ncbi:MAG: hypothetical protein ACOX9B_04575 [Candidatus Xenobium sp.]
MALGIRWIVYTTQPFEASKSHRLSGFRPELVAFLLFMFLVFGLLGARPGSAQSDLIRGGQGVGVVRLGQTLGELRKALGPPARVTSSPNDPNSKLLDYPKRGISVFLGSSGGVIGVVVHGRSWQTPEGIAVGTSQGQVTKLFGKGLVRGEGNLTYPDRGLAFSFRNGKVHTIYVFQREESRALMGDRLIDPGRRVGQILLGDPISRVEEAWGRADRVLPLGQGGQEKLYSFKEEAVGVVVLGGRIQGVILETGDFITREGVKVGSTRAEVLRAFGTTFRSEPGRIWYDVRGIGFWFQGDRVRQIQVVSGSR